MSITTLRCSERMSDMLARHAVRPVVWRHLGAVFIAMGAFAGYLASRTESDEWWMHGLWCLAGFAATFPTVLRMLRVPMAVVLTDHRLMFVASFSLYFLFGAALLAMGPQDQVDSVLRYYPITARDAMRVNAVNGLGFGVALLTASVFRGRWLGAAAARSAVLMSQVPPLLAIALLLATGGIAYTYALSFDLNLHGGIVPGIVRVLGKLSLAAVFLAAAYRGPGNQWLRIIGGVLAGVLALGGVLQFSKSEVLLAIAAFVSGLALRFGSRLILPLGVALLVVVYLVLGGLTNTGRLAVVHEGVRSLAERLDVVSDELVRKALVESAAEYGAWARLSYTVPQAAALDFQDEGIGGDGLRLLPWVLVPRVLDPDKPEITKTGREFHEKITGQSFGSSTGQGIFASGYYHGGWWGLLLASIACGWVVSQSTSIARAIVAREALLLYPLCLMGLYIAFRIDGDFVTDYVGAFMFILYPILALALASSVTGASRRAVSRPVG